MYWHAKWLLRSYANFYKGTNTPILSQGHLPVTFVDDSLLQRESKRECLQNIHDAVKLLEALGFTIHKEKLEPIHAIEFLGFVIDSIKMTVSLNPENSNAILKNIEHFEGNSRTKIRELAFVIGL